MSVMLIVCSCSELSEQETELLKNGRIYNEAIAADYTRTFTDCWNNVVYPLITEASEEASSKAVNEYNTNKRTEEMFGEAYPLLFMFDEDAEDKYNNSIDMTDKYIGMMQNIYTEFCELLESEIQENGLPATTKNLGSVINKIETNEDSSSWADDELGSQIAAIVCQSKPESFSKQQYSVDASWKLSSSWQEPVTSAIVQHKGTDAFAYQIMNTSYNWLQQCEDLSIDYCVKAEGSKNSYIVGYSNQTAFIVTFVRNDSKEFRYQWEEIEYDSTLVGQNLI